LERPLPSAEHDALAGALGNFAFSSESSDATVAEDVGGADRISFKTARVSCSATIDTRRAPMVIREQIVGSNIHAGTMMAASSAMAQTNTSSPPRVSR
jgi:hypothetical protein